VGKGEKTRSACSGKELERLRARVGPLELAPPTLLASGILASSCCVIAELASLPCLGGVVTKSATIEPKEGYQTPVVAGGACYVVNAMGLPNPGYAELAQEVVEALRRLAGARRAKVVASIAPSNEGEAEVMSVTFAEAGVDAIEINLSCPHAKKLGLEVGRDPNAVRSIVSASASVVSIPVIAKLGFSDAVKESAKAAESAGASAVSAINTVRGVVIDVYARAPVLSNVFGGVSGPAIRPIAVGVVYELFEELTIPIIGCGGVDSWEAALEFILAGARAVQVGTAVAYKGLEVFEEIAEGLLAYMDEFGFRSVEELVGLAHRS